VSKYKNRPLDFTNLKTVSIKDRGGKVRVEDFAREHRKGESVLGMIDSLPRLLAADGLRGVISAMLDARASGKPIIWGIGGHVIKCGLAPVLLGMMRRGYATAFSMNGSAAIHDFEIAIAGCTSEDVEAVLPDGKFGSAEETGREMNWAINDGNRYLLGLGEAVGKRLQDIADSQWAGQSLLYEAYKAGVPVTVHVAIGTDTPHTHPKAEGASIGGTSHRDFRLFCSLVKEMNQGGVYLNVGSAVVMPEVFLKAVSVVRNLGYPLTDFTTANFDFLQHYRPKANVVERPHANAGGKGYSITGHHEIMIPLLAAALVECEP
jgi:hypothetical protein